MGDSSAQNLPTSTDISTATATTPYSTPPWKGLLVGSNSGFRIQAQYGVHNLVHRYVGDTMCPVRWMRLETAIVHNLVHRYVGDTMGNMTSPNDPVFWLHHCNIDRLWAEWQSQHPAEPPYLPATGGLTGHNLNEKMIFSAALPAPWVASNTPQSAIDHHALGYQYDSEPTVQIAELRAKGVPNEAMLSRARTNHPLIQELTVQRQLDHEQPKVPVKTMKKV